MGLSSKEGSHCSLCTLYLHVLVFVENPKVNGIVQSAKVMISSSQILEHFDAYRVIQK